MKQPFSTQSSDYPENDRRKTMSGLKRLGYFLASRWPDDRIPADWPKDGELRIIEDVDGLFSVQQARIMRTGGWEDPGSSFSLLWDEAESGRSRRFTTVEAAQDRMERVRRGDRVVEL